MREQPLSVLDKLQATVENRNRIVISSITYSEMRFGAIGKKASSKHNILIGGFMLRIDAVLPWDQSAVDFTTRIKKVLSNREASIGHNDSMIAGHALSLNCVLITNNTK